MGSEHKFLSQSDLEKRLDLYIKLNFKKPLEIILEELENVSGIGVKRKNWQDASLDFVKLLFENAKVDKILFRKEWVKYFVGKCSTFQSWLKPQLKKSLQFGLVLQKVSAGEQKDDSSSLLRGFASTPKGEHFFQNCWTNALQLHFYSTWALTILGKQQRYTVCWVYQLYL